MASRTSDMILAIRTGKELTLTEPLWVVPGFIIGGGLFAVVGFWMHDGRTLFGWVGWGVLALGSLTVITGCLKLLFGRERVRIDSQGFTMEPERGHYPWTRVGRFFVVTGDVGERWVSFESYGAKPATSAVNDQRGGPGDSVKIVELSSKYGMSPERLAELMNELRSQLDPSRCVQPSAAATEEPARRARRGDLTTDNHFRSGPDSPVATYSPPFPRVLAAKRAREAIERSRRLLRSYYHPACGATTQVNDRVIVQATLDPWYFATAQTDCARCGTASMTDVVLHNGQTLQNAFLDMRKAVPPSGRIARRFAMPVLIGLIGGIFGLLVPQKDPRDPRIVAVLVCSFMGVMLGVWVSRHAFKHLRRLGLFW